MESTYKGYSLSKNGNEFITPHFQVKEFVMDGRGDSIIVSMDLVHKLELLSDCVNNVPIHINKTCSYERALIRAKNYTAEDLAIYAQACGFTSVKIVNKTVLDVSVDSSLKLDKDYIANCSWFHIRKVPFERIEHMLLYESRETFKTTAAKFDDYDLVISGSFFCTYKEPQFNLKIHGRVLKTYWNHKWGMIFTKDRIRYGELSQGNTFMSGHPILLDNGRFCDYTYASEIDGVRARTAIGYDDKNFYALVCDSNTKKGLTLRGLRQIMSYIGSKYAINVDGGGSCGMAENGNVVNKQADQRRLNNCILIKFKDTI